LAERHAEAFQSGLDAVAVAVERIFETVGLPIQFGGGVHNMATVEAGSAKAPTHHCRHRGGAESRAGEACYEGLPGRVAVGSMGATTMWRSVEGWAETSELTALAIAPAFRGRRRLRLSSPPTLPATAQASTLLQRSPTPSLFR